MSPVNNDMIEELEEEIAAADAVAAESKKVDEIIPPEDTIRLDGQEPQLVDPKTAESGDQVINKVDETKPVEKVVKPKKESKDKKDDFKQQYKVAQGLTKKQAEQISEQRDQISDLKDIVVNLQKKVDAEPAVTNQPVQAEVKPGKPETENVQLEAHKYLTESDIEAYGDTIEVIRKASREIVEDMLSKYDQQLQGRLDTRFTPLNDGIESLRELDVQGKQKVFMKDLSKLTPYAETMVSLYTNNDKSFNTWLDESMSGTPFSRRDAFDRYNIAFDAKGVAGIFDDYAKNVSANEQDNPQPEPNPQPAQQAISPSSQLDKLIAPEQSGNEFVPQTNDNKPMRHLSELKVALDSVRKGNMTPDQYEVIQSEIDQATIEGRVAI